MSGWTMTLPLALCVATTSVSSAQESRRTFKPVAADTLYFPAAGESWERTDPATAGWNAQALDAALAYAGSQHSSAVVILLDGRILAERVWDVRGPQRYARMHLGTARDGHPIEDVGSTQKSVVAFLAGVAEGKGVLDLGAPVHRYLGTGWSKAEAAAESVITVRHLMTMTSGLNDSVQFEQAVGSVWRYNTGAYSRMVGVLEKAAGADIDTLTQNWLTRPAGMADSRWSPRPWSAGNAAANSIGFATTARDLARFGLLILAGGTWNGEDLLRNPGYLARMLSPSQDHNPSYGLLWWLNGQPRVQRLDDARALPGSLIQSAPADLVAMMGTGDRKCYVVPSLRMVVARLGDQAGERAVSPQFDDEFWALLMKAAPR